ncbi:MAG: BCD family MFS transporter [Paracoccaceae bacterium]|nr:BCD family MFS transporter [Paracoccaceae bacterium]
MNKTLSWFSIFRLGLVQMALGSVIVLTTSTLNRLMIVEGALPAVIPGLLVSFHYGIQVTRPAWGFFSDTGKTRTKWILIGMTTLSFGGVLATLGTITIQSNFVFGITISIISYALIGLGVSAAGTSLLAYLAIATKPERRAAAASLTWLMMIFGIAVTAGVVGNMIDPFSNTRLITVISAVCVIAILITIIAVYGIEEKHPYQTQTLNNENLAIIEGLKEVWQEPKARVFTLFVAVSMTAYFMQELILEPYAGLVFNLTPGQTTSLSGVQNGGVFLGMLAVGTTVSGFKIGSLKIWVFLGCLGSALALITISLFGYNDFGLSISFPIVILGFCNGAFAVGAIGSMMQLAGNGKLNREGTRMGLWGASQAIAAGFGGLLGTVLVDLLRLYFLNPADAFGIVFFFEAILFTLAALMSLRIIDSNQHRSKNQPIGVLE